MKAQQMVRELEAVARQLGIQVRYEKGTFRGGHCRVGDDAYVVLNRLHPPELQFSVLAGSLKDHDLDGVFLAPVVRSAVEEAWRRADQAVPEMPDVE